jgi:hypothetical protein
MKVLVLMALLAEIFKPPIPKAAPSLPIWPKVPGEKANPIPSPPVTPSGIATLTPDASSQKGAISLGTKINSNKSFHFTGTSLPIWPKVPGEKANPIPSPPVTPSGLKPS